jgi:predicted ester cyclase
MSIEENKVKARRVIEEAVNKGNLAVLDEIIAPNYVYHSSQGDVKGPEGLKQFFNMLRAVLPDINIDIEDMVAEGDIVAYRFILNGTFKGEYMGIHPTGNKVAYPEAHFIRFEGGKEVEETPYANPLTLFKQMGIKPPGS